MGWGRGAELPWSIVGPTQAFGLQPSSPEEPRMDFKRGCILGFSGSLWPQCLPGFCQLGKKRIPCPIMQEADVAPSPWCGLVGGGGTGEGDWWDARFCSRITAVLGWMGRRARFYLHHLEKAFQESPQAADK